MEISLLGYLVIPFGLYSALFKPRLLFYSMVFFVPFSATAIINFPGFGLQPYHWFGTLLFLRTLAEVLDRKTIVYTSHQGLILGTLALFWIACLCSLAIPLALGQVTAFNITQLVYLTFGIMITCVVTVEVNTHENLWQAVSAYLYASLFCNLWGLYQLVAFRVGIAYPDFLFNNSHSNAADGYLQVIQETVTKRISSVAVEPSVFARFTLTAVAILTVAAVLRAPRRRLWAHAQLLLGLLTLVFSTSSTAYLALLFLLVSVLIRYVVKMVKLLPLLLGAFIVAAWTPQLHDVVVLMTVDKASSYSFHERFGSVTMAYESFLKHPILGSGWTRVQSYDLIVNLLSNVGIVGCSLFVMFVGMLLLASRRYSGALRHLLSAGQPSALPATQFGLLNRDVALVEGLQLAITVALVADLFSGFTFVFGHLWVLFGLLIGSLHLCRAHILSPSR